MAVVLAERGREEDAARLLGFTDAFYSRYAMKREQTEAMIQDRLLGLLRQRLDDATIESTRKAGRDLTDEQASEIAFT